MSLRAAEVQFMDVIHSMTMKEMKDGTSTIEVLQSQAGDKCFKFKIKMDFKLCDITKYVTIPHENEMIAQELAILTLLWQVNAKPLVDLYTGLCMLPKASPIVTEDTIEEPKKKPRTRRKPKSKETLYDRTSEEHKNIFLGLLNSSHPNWNENEEIKAQVTNTSKEAHNKVPLLTADGSIHEAFVLMIKGLRGNGSVSTATNTAL